jgi:hypothetical protein
MHAKDLGWGTIFQACTVVTIINKALVSDVSKTFPCTGIVTKEWWANILVWPRELWQRELGQLTDHFIALSINNSF